MRRTLILERVVAARQLLPRDVYFWVKALLLALIAIQLARLVWTLAIPVGPLGRWLPPTPAALPQAAQAALLSSFDPFARAGAVAGAAAPAVDTSGYKLFGTRMAAAGVPGSAIIAGSDGVQNSLEVGDEVGPGVRLAAVGFDFVMLTSGNAQQKLLMEGAEGEAAVPATAAPAVSATAPGQPLTADSIRQNIAFAPRNVGGRITGLLVSATGSPAVLRAAGLQDGDVVVGVNGRRITGAADAAALQSQVTPGARLSLQVERGASVIPIALILAGN